MGSITRREWLCEVELCTTHWRRLGRRELILWFDSPNDLPGAVRSLSSLGATCLETGFDDARDRAFAILREPKQFATRRGSDVMGINVE